MLFDVPASAGFLLGAILVVSGPTVVLPLLQSVRLREPVAPILRWECIVIDPIGAVLAAAVFESIVDAEGGWHAATVVASSAGLGTVAGLAGGFALALLLRLNLVPDRLHSPLTLALVIGTFVAANVLSVEAGLFATTVMGVVVANQRLAPVAHIAAFGEDVGVLLLGGLFIVLGATIEFEAMRTVLVPSLGLLLVLLLVRPVAVWVSTLGARLTIRERAFLSLIAPRGVVAASVAALFSVELQREGIEGATLLAPAAFIVIIGSVVFASVVAPPAATRLRVAAAKDRGILLAGDEPWLVDVAATLAEHEVPVLLAHVDADPDEAAARGVLTFQGTLDSDDLVQAADGVGVGTALVAVRTEAVSTFLVERLSEHLGRGNVYVVEVGPTERPKFSRAWGRHAFDRQLDVAAGAETPAWTIEVIPAGHDRHGESVDLFFLTDDEAPVVANGRKARSADAVVVARPA
jgi:hypothetical protein